MKKVLVVDDAAFMRMALRKMLVNLGYEVISEAENGVEGVRRYKECHPDLVTMDITMPELDGIGALKEIIRFDPNAIVIMVSALGQESYIKEAILSGAKYFIVKPFKEEHVSAVLNNVIKV
jgi:two-component system chemotaxis response regulator CheY